MKLTLVLPLLAAACIALLGFTRLRQQIYEKEAKRLKMDDTKARVSNDLLTEFRNDNAKVVSKLNDDSKRLTELEEQVKGAQNTEKTKKDEAAACQANQKAETDKKASIETEINNFKAEASKEKETWGKEVESLKAELAAQSKVCNFVKEATDVVRKLCPQLPEAAKKEEPKEKTAKKR